MEISRYHHYHRLSTQTLSWVKRVPNRYGINRPEKRLFLLPIPDSVTISQSCSLVKSDLLALRPQLLLSIPIPCHFKLSCNKIPHLPVILFSGIAVSNPRSSSQQLLTSLSSPVPIAAGNSCGHSPGCSDLQSPFLLCPPSCLRRGFRWRTQVAFTNNPSKQSSKEIKAGQMKKLVIVLTQCISFYCLYLKLSV